MTHNLKHRIRKMEQTAEDSYFEQNDVQNISNKRMVRIMNWIYTKGILPNATADQKEMSRLVAKIVCRHERLTDDERSWMASRQK